MSASMSSPNPAAGLSFIVTRYATAMPGAGPALGDMETVTWDRFAGILTTRRVGDKDGANIVPARFMPEPNGKARRTKANLVARTAIALDCEADKRTGEMPPDIATVLDRLNQHGWAAVLYTSHNHAPDAPRYRIVLPLSAEIAPSLPAVEVVADMLGLGGVLDRSKLNAASVFYLPSCAPGRVDVHQAIRVDGAPVDADWMQARAGAIMEAREREQAALRAEAMREAEKRAKARAKAAEAKGVKPTDKLIEQIRDRLDMHGELVRHGYSQIGDRYICPESQSGIPGVHVMTGSDGIVRVFSHHASDPLAADNLPSWCTVKAVDVVDLVTLLDFNGDRKKALHSLAERFGIGEPLKAKAAPEEPDGLWDVPPADDHVQPGWYSQDTLSQQDAEAVSSSPEVPTEGKTLPPIDTINGFPLTEDGIALAFTAAHHDVLRYDHTRGAWLVWSGKAWRQDETKAAFNWSRRTCRRLAKEAKAGGKLLAMMAKAATAAAVERFAQSDPALAVTSSIWDRDTFLLGTPGGTVNLKTGDMGEPNPDDLITRLTAVAPAASPDCPLWLAFLDQATNNDATMVRFLRQWCGYCLTGDTREHALLFAHGAGGNGKSVFLNTVAAIFGDYARNAAMDTFTSSTGDRHPTDLAMLRGARLVTASETEEGRAWAEARIKALTGGDKITARFMRRDFFEFQPEFKLTIVGNHKPILRNVDEASRRRFNLVPFTNQPKEKDKQLEVKLRAEWPGILRWMIEGCLDWQKNGLIRPKAVSDATESYFSEQDTVHQWVTDCCTMTPTQSDTVATLFKSWSDYALANGEKPGTSKWFSGVLVKLGCEPLKNTPGENGKRGFKGISVNRVAPKSHHDAERDDQ